MGCSRQLAGGQTAATGRHGAGCPGYHGSRTADRGSVQAGHWEAPEPLSGGA